MSFRSKILGRDQATSREGFEAQPCAHTILVPRWDSIDDMGKEDRATAYSCQACSATFSPDEAKALRHATAERLRMN